MGQTWGRSPRIHIVANPCVPQCMQRARRLSRSKRTCSLSLSGSPFNLISRSCRENQLKPAHPKLTERRSWSDLKNKFN